LVIPRFPNSSGRFSPRGSPLPGWDGFYPGQQAAISFTPAGKPPTGWTDQFMLLTPDIPPCLAGYQPGSSRSFFNRVIGKCQATAGNFSIE
jgi:hypothetical protein